MAEFSVPVSLDIEMPDDAETSQSLHGILRLEKDSVVLEYRIHESDEDWNEKKSDVKEYSIALEELQGVDFDGGWWFFSGTLTLRAHKLRSFEKCPGSSGADLQFGVESKDRKAASQFSVHLKLALEESRLKRQLDGKV